MKVELDEKTHLYTYEGRPVPGFSEICKALGIIKPNPFYTADGRAEGNAIHQWLLFLAKGYESNEAPDPRIAGRVEGIRKFLRESAFRFVGGEEPQYCADLGYCGSPDLWGIIDSRTCVLDCKRGAKMKHHALQTAAYRLLLSDNRFNARQRFCLYLRDGDYRLIEHTDDQDEKRWRAIVSAYNASQFYKEGA